jgi:hypothetical protein
MHKKQVDACTQSTCASKKSARMAWRVRALCDPWVHALAQGEGDLVGQRGRVLPARPRPLVQVEQKVLAPIHRLEFVRPVKTGRLRVQFEHQPLDALVVQAGVDVVLVAQRARWFDELLL